MKNVVFIHTNSKQIIGAKLAEYLLKSESKNPDSFEVRYINLDDFDHLKSRHGQEYLRKGKLTKWNNDDLQSFTPLRFLPPQLMGYEGKAIVIDPDVFALADIQDLFDRDMKGKGILCRTIHPEDGRPSYYATSVMLLDCAKLKHWDWNKRIDEMFAKEIDYRDWMSLYLEDPENIGEIEEEWNSFDILTDETKLLHNTTRNTQPWKTGLPIDFMSKKLTSVHEAKEKKVVPESFMKKVKRKVKTLLGKEQPKKKVKAVKKVTADLYKTHPDENQIKFFFDCLNKAVSDGAITMDLVKSEMEKKNVRQDILKVMEQYN